MVAHLHSRADVSPVLPVRKYLRQRFEAHSTLESITVLAFPSAVLNNKVTFANMEATKVPGSSHVGEEVDKARKRVRKRSSEWESDSAIELQPVMAHMQPASLVQPIWHYSRNPVHPSGSALRSQEQDLDLPTTVLELTEF